MFGSYYCRNESYDLDVTNKYPNDTYDGSPEYAKTFLIIDAFAKLWIKVIADFFKLRKNNVDIYAPEDEIYATPLNS